MKTTQNILSFRQMLSPYLLQVLFWGAIVGVLYGTYVLIELDNWAWALSLVFGILAVRVIFERLILAFQTYDRLCEIRNELLKLNEQKS